MTPTAIVAGCGRSGTQWINRGLRSCGILSAHEEYLGLQNLPHNGVMPDQGDLQVEVGLGAAWFYGVMHPDTRVVHVRRDPWKIAASWYRIEAFSYRLKRNPPSELRLLMTPSVFEDGLDEATMCVRHVLEMGTRSDDCPLGHFTTLRLEDLSTHRGFDQLIRGLGLRARSEEIKVAAKMRHLNATDEYEYVKRTAEQSHIAIETSEEAWRLDRLAFAWGYG